MSRPNIWQVRNNMLHIWAHSSVGRASALLDRLQWNKNIC